MRAYSGVERRRSPRVRDSIKVRMKSPRTKSFGTALNTSLHGILVRTKRYFCPDEKIGLLLYIPSRRQPVYALGKVVRTVAKVSFWGFRFRMEVGIEFLELSKAHREVLAAAIARLAEKARLGEVPSSS